MPDLDPSRIAHDRDNPDCGCARCLSIRPVGWDYSWLLSKTKIMSISKEEEN